MNIYEAKKAIIELAKTDVLLLSKNDQGRYFVSFNIDMLGCEINKKTFIALKQLNFKEEGEKDENN